MSLTFRDFWTVVHGMGLGAIFLLAYAGGLAGIYSMRPEWVTLAGLQERIRRMVAGTWIMAIVAWVTVITGTYIVYPWYRAPAPQGAPPDVLAGQLGAVSTAVGRSSASFPARTGTIAAPMRSRSWS